MDYTVSSIQLLDRKFCHIFYYSHYVYHLKERALALACRVLCIVSHLESSLLRESDPQMIQLGITYWQFQLGKCVHFFLVTISLYIWTCVWDFAFFNILQWQIKLLRDVRLVASFVWNQSDRNTGARSAASRLVRSHRRKCNVGNEGRQIKKKKNHLYKFRINFVYQIPVCIKFVRQFIFQLKKKARAYFFFSCFNFILFVRCIET